MMIACMAMSSAFGAVTWYLNESFETGQIPQDWTQEVLSSNVAYWTVEDTATVPASAKYPATGFSSQYYVALRNLTGMDKHYVTRLITPPIDFVSSGAYLPILTFAHAQPGIAGDFDTLRVSYRPNANTPWVPIVEYSSRIDLWRTDTLDLPGYFSATEYQLAFEIIENMGRGVVLDDIRIKNTSFCTPASDLTVTIPGSTGVRLTWVGDLETDQFEVVVSEQPITDWDNYTAVYHGYSGEFFADVEGLSSATFYYAYVRAHCIDSEQDWTDWTSVTFETIIGAELPYTENFGPNLPALWTRGTSFSDARPSFSAGNTTSVDSSYAMVFSSINAGNYAYAAMPEIPVALSNVEVGFWGAAGTSVKTPSSNYSGRLYLGVMTNPNDVATFEVVDSVTLSVAHKHEYFTVPFQAYAGRGRFIAFMARDPEQNTTFNVDKVTVREVPTFTPTHVKVSKVTPDGFDIKANLNGATSMNIRVARATDYVHMNAVMPSSFLVSQNGISGNSYHVNAQLGDSIVAVYVQGVKNGVAGDWSFPVIVRIPARASLPLVYNFNDNDPTVSLVSLEKELRSTSASKAAAGVYFTPLEYAYYYPALSKATTKPVYSGAHLQLRGNDRWFALPYIDNLDNLGLSFRLAAASAGQSRVAVGVMTDPYDLSTFTQLATFDGGAATYVKCDVDLSEYEGTGHYVAIRAIAPATPQVSYGGSVNHIDDLTVQEIVGCRAPSRPKVTVTAFSATITWKANNMTSWKAVLYDAAGTTALDSMVVNSPSATFTNLQPETTYKYHLTTICSGETVPMEDKFAFTTPMAMPLVETFDELTQSFIIPTGWSNTEGTTTSLGYRWMYYANGYEGHCVRFNSESNAAGNTNYLALPAVYLTRAAVLKFWWKNAQGGPAKVLISTDGGETRVKLDSLRQSEEWVDYEIDLSTYTGQTVNIYFLATSNANQSYHYLDEVKVVDMPTCLHPQNLVISDIEGNSARASWSAGSNETQWQYVAVPQGQALDWANGVVVDSTKALISGLDALTTYELYVRGYCSASDQSEAIKKTFTTACGIVAIPFEETFTGLSSSNPIPVCWDNSKGTMTSDSYKWSTYGSGYQGACLRFNSYSATNGQTNYLRSPDFNITSACKLSFMWKNPAGGAGEVFIAQAGDTANLVSVISSGLTGVSTWKEVTIDLTQYVGQTINIYFKGTSNYGSGDAYLYLDNVKIVLIDVNCRGVSSIRANAASATTANVQWIAGGTQEVDIEVSDSVNYGGATVYSAVSSNPFIVNGLTENTTYYVRVRQTCDSLGDWVEDSFKTLCFPKDVDDLGLVTFNGGASDIDCWSIGYTDPGTTSSPTKPTVASSTGLGRYLSFSKRATSKTSSDTTYYSDGLYAMLPELAIDSVNHYEITFNAFKTTSTSGDLGRIEVGVITDPADFATFTAVQTLTLDYAADSTEEKSYTVNFVNYVGDYNDDYGKYIMFRTQAGDSSLNVGIDNIEVTPLSNCPRIVEGVITNIEESSVTYKWEANGADSYSVVILPEIGNPNEAVNVVYTGEVTADSIVITDLSPATYYYAYVRANCEGAEGRWSAFSRFHTACGVKKAPFTENFNGAFNDIPLCWDNTQGKTTTLSYRWTKFTSDGVTGNCLRFNSYNNSKGNDNFLATPSVELDQPTILTFMWKNPAGGGAQVYLEIDGDSTLILLMDSAAMMGISEWTEKEIDLTPYQGETVRILFYSMSNWGYDDAYHYLDDVEFLPTMSCYPLNGMTINNVNRKGFTVTLNAKRGHEAPQYDLVCSTAPLTEDALDTVAKITVDSTGVYTFSDRIRETQYYLYARANCGDGDVSTWVSGAAKTKGLVGGEMVIVADGTTSNSYFPVYGTYADTEGTMSQSIYPASMLTNLVGESITSLHWFAKGSNSSWADAVVQVKMGITQVSSFTGAFLPTAAMTTIYTGTLDISAEDGLTIDLATPFEYTGGNLAISFEVISASLSYGSVSFDGVNLSNTISRYSYDTYSGEVSNNSTFLPKLGLTYIFNLEACPEVTNISSKLLGNGTSEALITWDASQGDYVSGYDVFVSGVELPDSAEIVPTYTNIQSDSLVVNGLEADSTYYIYIRANCMADGHDDGISTWASYSFTTLAGCPAVVGLQSELKSTNVASVSWGTAYASQEESFVYVLSTDTLSDAALDAAAKVTVSDTTGLLLTDLAYDQTYYLYVASACAEAHSLWSMTSFTTEPMCTPALNLHTEAVYHNRVRLSWSKTPYSSALRWEVGLMGSSTHTVYVTDTTALLTGLEGQTNYVAYVHAICTDEATSADATVPFTTLAVPVGGCKTIGTHTGDGYNLPFDNYWKNAWVQTIYKASVVANSGVIESIAFLCTAVDGSGVVDSLRIYMGHTSMDSVASTSSWVPASDLTQVYSSSAFVHPTTTGWYTINLDRPFLYNGIDNLAVVVSSMRPAYSSSQKYALTQDANTVSLYRGSDSYAYYADQPGAGATGTMSKNRADIQLCFQDPECPGVINIQAKNITTTEAMVVWEPTGAEDEWKTILSTTMIEDFTGYTPNNVSSFTLPLNGLTPDTDYWLYVQPKCGGQWNFVHFITKAICTSPVGLSVDSITPTSAVLSWEDEYSVGENYMVIYGPAASFSIEDSVYQTAIANGVTTIKLENLSSSTNYSFAVRSLCAGSLNSRFSDVVNFFTECGVAAIPFYEDFNSLTTGIPACWANTEGSMSSTYRWSYYATGYEGAGLRLNSFSATSGTTNFLALPPIALTVDANLTFMWKNPTGGVGEVLVSTDGGTTKTSLFSNLQSVATWTPYEIDLSAYTGQTVIIYFKGTSNYGSGDAYLYLDNVRVDEQPACSRPRIVNIYTGTNDATVVVASKAASLQIQYAIGRHGVALDSMTVVTAPADSFVISGLNPNTPYDLYVRSLCTDNDTSAWADESFYTECVAFSLPFSETFDFITEGIPMCWDNSESTMTNESHKWNKYATGYDGACVRLNSYSAASGQYNILATPSIVISDDATLSFWWKNAKGGAAQVLISTDGGQTTTVLLDTLTGISSWTKKEVFMTPYVGDTVIIYFKGTSNYGNDDAYLYLDEVNISTYDANCQGISDLTASNVTLSGAQLDWNYVAGYTNAEVQVATDINFTLLTDSAVVTGVSTYFVSGLQASTTYYIRVRQVCDNDNFSAWSRPISFLTGIGLPFAPTFSSTSFPDGWTRSNTSANQVFGGAQMVSTTGGWSLTSSYNTVISATHFKGNIFGSSWNNWVVTPAIDLTPNVGEGIMLTFEAALTDYNSTTAPDQNGVDDRFLVAVSIDGGETWNAANVVEWNNNGTGDYVYNEVPVTGGEYTINMSDYAGHVVKIGFYGESTTSNADNDFHFGKINLHKVPSITYTDTVCSGELFVGNGFTISADDMHVGLNAFSRYEQGTSGEMELTIQQVYMLPPANDTIRVELCEGEHYNDYGFDFTVTKSEVIRQRFLGGSIFGCDSMVYLYVTMLPTVYGEEYAGITEGESYTWHGKTFYQSTIATDTTSSAVTGCDSITTLYLTLCPLVEKNYHAAFCRGTVYEDEFFSGLTDAGIFETVKETEQGCQAHARIILRELAPGQDYVDSVEVKDLPYVFEDDTILLVTDQPGTRYHRQKDFGCGTVNVDVHVINRSALDNVAAANLRIAPNPVAVGQDITILTDLVATSDYSCRVFDAVGKLVYETDMPSKTIPGLPTAGLYTVRISSGNTLYQGKLIVK